MTDKIIDEVMGLISDWSEKDFLWGSAQIDTQSEMATSADFFNEKRYEEEAKSAKEAIRAKLREVLERKPLSDEQIWEINAKSNVPHRHPEYVTDCWGDEKTIWHETATFSFSLFARNIERAHNIGAE